MSRLVASGPLSPILSPVTDPNSPPKKLPIPWGHVINYLILVDDQRAEDLYVEAIDRLRRCRIAFDLARDHLLYGEWLRRKRRRLDARKELRAAHDLFTDFGMDAFAERAPRRAAGYRRARA